MENFIKAINEIDSFTDNILGMKNLFDAAAAEQAKINNDLSFELEQIVSQLEDVFGNIIDFQSKHSPQKK